MNSQNPYTPWLKGYPEGVKPTINADEFSNLPCFINAMFKRHANRQAVSNYGSTLSYHQLDDLSRNLAAYLQSIGLKPGQKVGVILPNCLQSAVVIPAVIRAGLVLVNLNPRYKPWELEQLLTRSDCQCVITMNIATKALEQIIANTPVKSCVVTELGDLFGWVKAWIANRRSAKKMQKFIGDVGKLPNVCSLNDAIKIGRRRSLLAPESTTDVAVIQFTSGTSGMPKGVMLTHRNILANINMFVEWLGTEISDVHVAMTPIPIYHVFALVVNLFGSFRLGAHNILITDPTDPSAINAAFKQYPIEAISAVNALYELMLKNDAFRSLDFSNLKIAVGGATEVTEQVAADFKHVTGVTITQGYGKSETSPAVSIGALFSEAFSKNVGKPLPSTLVRIVDEEGNNIWEPHKEGELLVKGPQVMKGYLGDPEATQKTIVNGWLHTEDIFEWDKDHNLIIKGRKDDMFKPGSTGLCVSPGEVEEAVMQYPHIEAAACFWVMYQGQKQGKLVVIPGSAHFSLEALIKHCRNKLAGYKQPMFVEVMQDRTEFYVNDMKKVQRKKFQKRESRRDPGLLENEMVKAII